MFGSATCEIYVEDKGEFPDHTFENYNYTEEKDEGVERVQDCEDHDELDHDYTDWMVFMEDYFSCSGLCDAHGFYVFTDVNKGVP